jgi:uncharacterized membrane protein (UPF0127 family)
LSRLRLAACTAIALAGVAACDASERVAPQPQLPLSSVSVATAGGRTTFVVEVATTPAQQEAGLMLRASMPRDRGMLFVFRDDEKRVFWMRNTLIPLDLAFIRADGTVANLSEDATPLSDAYIPSAGPVRYVLELDAGTARQAGVVPGAKVEIPR